MDSYLAIQFFSVGCGDAIALRFLGNDNQYHNLLIDAGFSGTYRASIQQELIAIQKRQEVVDIWCITHTDDDHINGINVFLKDPLFKNIKDIVNQFWFNWSDYPAPDDSSKVSVKKGGITLRDYLKTIANLRIQDILTTIPTLNFFGAKITILSPDELKLEASKIAWQKEEHPKKISSKSDYDETVCDLLKYDKFEEDNAPYNGGSIAFLFEYNDVTILFLADSHPSVIETSLRHLGFSESNKLRVDYVKVAHHGSKKNTSPNFLNLINCSNFVVSANGIRHDLPDKVTLSRILESRKGELTHFWFTHQTRKLESIFAVDGLNIHNDYPFKCHYPEANTSVLRIDIPFDIL